MKRMLGVIGLILLVASGAATASPPEGAPGAVRYELTVQVRGLRNASGDLLVLVFDQSRGFPDTPDKALRQRILKLDAPGAVMSFTDLPPGEYAVAVVHDENRNQKLDKGFFGIPKEGFGVSNNVKPTIGAPSFKDAKLSLSGDKLIVIDLIYY